MRRSIIALLVGALISMGLGAAASDAGTATVDAATGATTPLGAPDGVDCYSIPTSGGASLDLCDHGHGLLRILRLQREIWNDLGLALP